MAPHPMAASIAKLFRDDPQLAFDFYCAASEIVDDFEDYGPVLQANEDGTYDEATTIMKLKACRDRLTAGLGRKPPAR